METLSYLHHGSPELPTRSATWIISAPWAHPFWDNYAILCIDLTTPSQPPPRLYREDVTHEVQVYALNRASELPSQESLKDFVLDGRLYEALLHPANHIYQFVAAGDDQAYERVLSLIWAIEAKELSPDTDFISRWDQIFADGISLRGKPGPSLIGDWTLEIGNMGGS